MPKSNFIHLHTHSHYSLLDGLTKIPDLVAKAKEYNMNAVALTDHGVMYGAIEFYLTCKKQGIKPIIGCEVYIAPRKMTDKQPKIDARPFHLVLLVKNMEGYKNLIKLVTQANLVGFYYKPRIDKALLAKYGKGLIAMTACLGGEIPRLILSDKIDQAKKAIEFYQNIFGKDDFYLEVQYHPNLTEQVIVNKAIFELSKKTGAKIVLTNDSHYLNTDDQPAHEVLLAVQTGKDFDDKARLSMANIDASFYSPEHANKIFSNHPEVIANTLEAAEKCNLELQLDKTILPTFDLPKNETNSFSYLEKLAKLGLIERYGADNQEAQTRLEFELGVIKKTGFADYFLIVSDLINWAKSKGIIVGPGRGSAAGSLVAYCLKITDLEPLAQNLLFERFLNPERISMPDIDIDFADDRRGEVIKYVQQKYGEDHVAQIITFGTMAARGSLRDTGRALGISYDEVDKIAKLIPMGENLKQSLQDVAELKNLYDGDPQVKKLIDMAKKLEGVARHASTHACGVVISREPLTEYLPLQMATKGETSITTQYSMNYVDKIGLLKIDFLGLANLTIIKNALRIINKIYHKQINISKIPMDDKLTFAILAKAQTTGVFQLESSGMKRYLKQLKPSCFDDIIAMVALYRPGPMELIPDYIDRKHGRQKITYLHPKLEPILKSTYGIAVYQEQLMHIARALAGFSLAEADVLRKAVGKKIKSLLQEQKLKLISGMVKNDVSKETAQKIWDFVEPFAAYGFNKSHAACYALIAYQTAYLKAHYPKEFMAALLTSDFGNLDRIGIEISECKKMGITILPPDVNKSFVEFGAQPDKNVILFGLEAIKGVGVKIAEEIINERKKNGIYSTLEDFIIRLSPYGVINKKTMEALAKSGALDSLCERNKIIANIDIVTKFANGANKNINSHQTSLFADTADHKNIVKLNLPEIEPSSKIQRLSWERELLGIYLSEHPLDEYKEAVQKMGLANIADLKTSSNKVKIVGIVSSVQKIITKSKEPMVFSYVEDSSGRIEALVFPKTLKKNPFLWKTENILLIEGSINSKDGVLKILVNDAKEFDKNSSIPVINNNNAKKIMEIHFLENSNKQALLDVKNLLIQYPGVDNIVLFISQQGELKVVHPKIQINTNKELINKLKQINSIHTIVK